MSGRNPAQFRSIVTEVVYGNTGPVSAGSVAANSILTIGCAVPGAVVGDFVEITCNQVLTAGLLLGAEVTAADTVSVKFVNPSIGALAPAGAATYFAIVYKRQPNVLI